MFEIERKCILIPCSILNLSCTQAITHKGNMTAELERRMAQYNICRVCDPYHPENLAIACNWYKAIFHKHIHI